MLYRSVRRCLGDGTETRGRRILTLCQTIYLVVEQNDILTVVPKIDDRLEQVLEYSDSVVLMKASRNTSQLETIIEEKERPKEIYSVQNCTRENEKIIEGFSNEKPYLTTTVIKFSD